MDAVWCGCGVSVNDVRALCSGGGGGEEMSREMNSI